MPFGFLGVWSPFGDVGFLVRFFLALLALYFGSTLFSIYQQERRIPSVGRVLKAMCEGILSFPSLFAHRLRHAPSRARHSLKKKKRRVAARIHATFSRSKKGISSRIRAWAAKHAQESRVKIARGKKKFDLREAVHLFSADQTFFFSPDALNERYVVGAWRAYEARQGPHKVWVISPRVISKKKLVVKLRRTKKGFYLEA
ncbi:MAG: hypothetical protein Q8P05_01330 [Candidatus Diapherotrites archaeon]|nr:hypothetical protein [Candidatus Diapherotrites archaeon]